jgi:putative ABC transport system permease protein
MSWIGEMWRRVAMLMRRDKFEAELREEMRAHREMKERELREEGMSAEEARYRASREFGNTAWLQEESRGRWGWDWLEDLAQDFAYGARGLRKSPGFTATAVITLILGIGATTAIFSVVNGVLLRPLRYAEPGQLVRIEEKHRGWDSVAFSHATYRDLVTRKYQALTAIAGYRPFSFNVTGGAEPEQVDGALVSANIFSVLGVAPELGRGFTEEEQRNGADHVVVLSYGLWQRRFGGDPEIIGKTIRVSDTPREIVGVMPARFEFPDKTQWLPGAGVAGLWVPLAINGPFADNRKSHLVKAIGRLAPGASLAAAQGELDGLAQGINEQYPGVDPGLGIGAWNLQRRMTEKVRPALLVLLGAVGLMVLAACANVANLVLMRNTGRSREFAVRVALGAGRGRLLRQCFVESLLLGVGGGVGGILLASWSMKLIAAFGPQDIPRLNEARIDGQVLAFAMGLSLLTAAIFGAAPAAGASGADPNESLKEGAKGTTSAKGNRLRGTLVVAEMALALMLLAGGGLLINSFVRLAHVSPGFDESHLLTMSVFLSPEKYAERQNAIAPFLESVEERTRALPGVVSVGVVNSLPIKGGVNTDFEIVGRPRVGSESFDADVRIATDSYFATMRIPLLRGRSFNAFDTESSAKVMVISQAMAQKYWPNEDPIGKRVTMLNWGPPLTGEIVGIVGDVKDALDYPATSFFYWPERQFPSVFAALVVRTTGDPMDMAASVKAAVWSVDPNQPVSAVQSMEQVLANSVGRLRMQTVLLGVFAGLALLMAMVGIYGVMAYSVSGRAREIGIRMALGASGSAVRRLILGEGLFWTTIGTGLGLAGAVALAGVLSSLLFGVSPRDPWTLLCATLLLVGVAMMACYLPARRAMQVDPMKTLRAE